MKKTILLLSLLSINLALADEGSERIVTLGLGPAIPTTSGGVSSLAITGRIGTDLGRSSMANGHIGLLLGMSSISTSIGGLTEADTATYILAEYLARQAFGTGLYFGARAGVAMLNSHITGSGVDVNGTATAFSYAPVIGYEIPVANQFGVTVDASWLTRGATTMTIPAVGTVDAKVGQSLILIGGVSYRF